MPASSPTTPNPLTLRFDGTFPAVGELEAILKVTHPEVLVDLEPIKAEADYGRYLMVAVLGQTLRTIAAGCSKITDKDGNSDRTIHAIVTTGFKHKGGMHSLAMTAARNDTIRVMLNHVMEALGPRGARAIIVFLIENDIRRSMEKGDIGDASKGIAAMFGLGK